MELLFSDFGTESVISRVGQLKPTLLIAIRKYSYNGKNIPIGTSWIIKKAIPTIKTILYVKQISNHGI